MKALIKSLLPVALVFLYFAGAAAAAKELSWQEVARELMSPACPGKLVIDCPSGEGEQLRTLIRQKVEESWDKDRIKKYYVDMYGQEYLAAPAKKGFFLLVWVVPFAVVIMGAFVVFLITCIWKRKGETEEAAHPSSLPEKDKDSLLEKLDDELDKFEF